MESPDVFINEIEVQNENENNTANKFRVKQLSNVLNILKKYPEKITLDNLGSLKEVGGIGKGSIDRIIEILSNGSLSELGNFVDNNTEKNQILQDLESVVGIGHAHALELYNKGIKSVKDLKKQIKDGKIKLASLIKNRDVHFAKFPFALK
jgi:DNA polymerase/3'-5' exonuclease PolX